MNTKEYTRDERKAAKRASRTPEYVALQRRYNESCDLVAKKNVELRRLYEQVAKLEGKVETLNAQVETLKNERAA